MESKNQIALVTGGSRGLGKDMALRLAEIGLDIIITYFRQKELAQAVVSEIRGQGRKAIALQLDTGEVRGFDAFFTTLAVALKTEFSTTHFDYLVNNAGVGIHALFQDTTEDQFNQLLNVQFKGVYFLTQKAIPYMIDGGGIVNISTGLTRFALPGFSAYACMKSAIETLTRYQARELGARGIRVNVVAPGAIATDFGGGAVRDNPQFNANIRAMTTLGRVGVADDIGGVVAFLCTDDARWITAQRIEVSGGMNL